MQTLTTVSLVTLGCARNEVDSEELAARLEAGGFRLVDDPADAETVVVNTCGFVEAAKKDSVDTLLEAADLKESGTTKAVVAVGCMAERYGKELATSLPEADAVLGFDDYPDIADRLRTILAGGHHEAHTPAGPPQPCCRSRRRRATRAPSSCPGTRIAAPDLPADAGTRRPVRAPYAVGSTAVRWRRSSWPAAATGAARSARSRASAARSCRGAPATCSARRRWLAEQGVKELFLVSENSTSYGKDLGDLRLLETLLPELAAIDGVERVRVSYLQPAETRPGLVTAIAQHRRASRATSTCPSSTRRATCCAGCAASATRTASWACSSRSAPRRRWPASAPTSSSGSPARRRRTCETLCDFLERGPARRRRRVRLLRRGRHRGRDVRRQARRGRDPRRAPST